MISIITAVYADTPQKVDWLGEAIQSVRSQTFEDWEMIVIDDHSPVLIDRVKVDDDRIRWARSVERSGPAKVRNTAVAACRGEAILPLDADDLLVDENVLKDLYDAWAKDKSKFVYGTVLVREDGRPPQEIKLPPYEFQLLIPGTVAPSGRIANHLGAIPVTALHAKSVWREIGGWKHLNAFEDAEYWIAAGELGFCGKNIGRPTLVYRRHDESRTMSMRRNGLESSTMTEIRNLHKDTFEGRYPVGCCGGSSKPVSAPQSRTNVMAVSSTGATELTQDVVQHVGSRGIPTERVWIEYNGKASGGFGVRGQVTGVTYMIEGPGHLREIFAVDAQPISRLGRGKDFSVGVNPPQPEPEPEPAKEPEMATVVREPAPVEVIEVEEEPVIEEPDLGLGGLDINNAIREKLEAADWTLPRLAWASEEELTEIKGIGPVTAQKLIEEAKELW